MIKRERRAKVREQQEQIAVCCLTDSESDLLLYQQWSAIFRQAQSQMAAKHQKYNVQI